MLLYRLKKILRTGLVFSLLAGLCFYFGFHLFDGEQGLISFWKLQDNQVKMHTELVRLQNIRAAMQKNVNKLNSDNVDGDLLDELARDQLGLVGVNDLVILRPKT